MLDEFNQLLESVDIDKVNSYEGYMMANNIENSLNTMQKGINAWSNHELTML